MPEISAFRALRYNPERFGRDLSKLVAPPYDVLTAEDKRQLLTGSDRNIVAVDLPHVPPKSAGPEAVYQKAANVLRQWRQDGTLAPDQGPAIYAYHQLYEHQGRRYTRKKFFARLRLEEFGRGGVFPHEQTFGGPKEDRLKLMQATRCQLSAVFGLYSDPSNAVSKLLDVGRREPDVTAELDGVHNRLWAISDPATIRAVSARMAKNAVYIADGHHRYGTALMYRDQLAAGGTVPPDHPANFVLVGFCAMEDPGALILPTHRILSGFGPVEPQAILAALAKGVEMTPLSRPAGDFAAAITPNSPYDLAIYAAPGERMYAGKFTRRSALKQLAPEHCPAWRQLDLAYLHRYLIDELLTRERLGGQPPTIHYARSGPDAWQIVRETGGIALLCKACTMADLRGVSEAGDLMPPKSTFFYPKLATGLVINPLE